MGCPLVNAFPSVSGERWNTDKGTGKKNATGNRGTGTAGGGEYWVGLSMFGRNTTQTSESAPKSPRRGFPPSFRGGGEKYRSGSLRTVRGRNEAERLCKSTDDIRTIIEDCLTVKFPSYLLDTRALEERAGCLWNSGKGNGRAKRNLGKHRQRVHKSR